MKKTFWSVKYSVWGADRPRTKWFASKPEALEFYGSTDYVDKPVAHSYSRPEKIAEIEEMISGQRKRERLWEN